MLIGGYLLFTAAPHGAAAAGPADAEVADGEGELGHFSPGSYFPFFIAASAATILLGVQFGYWLAIIGVSILLGSVIGLLFENLIDHYPDGSSH